MDKLLPRWFNRLLLHFGSELAGVSDVLLFMGKGDIKKGRRILKMLGDAEED